MEIRVDLRVELMSVLFHLARNPEYEAFDTPYRRAVDSYFEAFRDHEAVRAVRELRAAHSISYNAPVGLAVFLDDKTLLPAVRLDQAPELDARWKGVAIGVFLGHVREFAIESKAGEFFVSQQGYIREVVERISKAVLEHDIEAWFKQTFAHPADVSAFVVVPGLLTGPWNYEAAAHDACGHRLVYQVVQLEGIDTKGLPTPSFTTTDLVAHEMAHAFVNPIVEQFAAELTSATAAIFEKARPAMERNHYNTQTQLVEEMLVRAFSALFARDRFGREVSSQLVIADLEQGFTWNVELAKSLDAKPRPFDLVALMPELLTWFRDVAPNLPAAG
jgi:hypothetical protein